MRLSRKPKVIQLADSGARVQTQEAGWSPVSSSTRENTLKYKRDQTLPRCRSANNNELGPSVQEFS